MLALWRPTAMAIPNSLAFSFAMSYALFTEMIPEPLSQSNTKTAPLSSNFSNLGLLFREPALI